MRESETVLAVIRERGKRGLPLEDAYRQLYNPDLYLKAYGRIYANQGATTRGVTEETVDGMSQEKIAQMIEALRFERWRWTPVRRTHIPKKNGKTRPLGIPTWSDKLLQEVMRSLLEAYYEPQFSDRSHGFRPARGCHTALQSVQREWNGTKWFIEFDIKGFFDSMDHEVLLSILRERIQDNRFLRLIENLLKAGYCEQWEFKPTLSGTPQGGIISPLLANIYLSKLDQYVEGTLLPEHNRGDKRKVNREYHRINATAAYLRNTGRSEAARVLDKQKQSMPSVITDDPDYRRLRYIRYADDFLLGSIGTRAEAEEIRARVERFLQENLKLTVSTEKTRVGHATEDGARFLGYDITAQRSDTKHTNGRRAVNGVIALRIPPERIEEFSERYRRNGDAIHRAERLNDSDFTIVSRYQSEYRGYVQYYKLAQNLAWMSKVKWVMETSLLKTLAHKHKSSVKRMAKTYQAPITTPGGQKLRALIVRVEREGKKPLVTYFGGISLKRCSQAEIEDRGLNIPWGAGRTELEKRLLADRCEFCSSSDGVEVHHIRQLADLHKNGRRPKPLWMQVMSARRRKTLVLCQKCHNDLHAGRPLNLKNGITAGEPDDAKASRPVRRGLVGKGAEQ